MRYFLFFLILLIFTNKSVESSTSLSSKFQNDFAKFKFQDNSFADYCVSVDIKNEITLPGELNEKIKISNVTLRVISDFGTYFNSKNALTIQKFEVTFTNSLIIKLSDIKFVFNANKFDANSFIDVLSDFIFAGKFNRAINPLDMIAKANKLINNNPELEFGFSTTIDELGELMKQSNKENNLIVNNSKVYL